MGHARGSERTIALELSAVDGLSDDDDDDGSVASDADDLRYRSVEDRGDDTLSRGLPRFRPPPPPPASPSFRSPTRRRPSAALLTTPSKSEWPASTSLEKMGARLVGGALLAAAAVLPSPKAPPARPAEPPLEFRPMERPLRSVLADVGASLNIGLWKQARMVEALEDMGAKTVLDLEYLSDKEFGELGLSPDKEARVRTTLRELGRR